MVLSVAVQSQYVDSSIENCFIFAKSSFLMLSGSRLPVTLKDNLLSKKIKLLGFAKRAQKL